MRFGLQNLLKTDTKFPDLTTHDVLKALAVIIMIADHIGYYFFPENMWWRAVGRIGFPVWFFLIGYARGRDIDKKLLIGGILLVLANLAVGRNLLPLNALWTIIALRLSLDMLTRFIQTSETRLLLITAALAVLHPFLSYAWEYGGIAFIFALAGYVRRNGFGTDKIIPLAYSGLACVLFIALQQWNFPFTTAQSLLMALGSVITTLALVFYLPRPSPGLTLPRPVNEMTMLLGRRTLEIYVLHLILFKVLEFLLKS